jgi:hypothetical protein
VVARLGRADEVVVGDAEAVPRLLEPGGVAVGLLLGRDARRFGRLGDLEAVLVGAREEVGVVAEQPMPPRYRVSDDRGVGVADVGGVVDVVDRCGDEEAADRLRIGAEPVGAAPISTVVSPGEAWRQSCRQPMATCSRDS